MLAVASSCVVPAIERWGVLVTNSGATVILIFGALYVFSPFTPFRLVPFEFAKKKSSLTTSHTFTLLLLLPPRRPGHAAARLFS